MRFSNGIESSDEIGAGFDFNSITAYLENLAHIHELLEQGIEVAVIKDATAVVQILEDDGYLAALIKFRFMANAVWTTDDAVERLTK